MTEVLENLFSLPEVITGRVWDTYFQGKQAYVAAQEKAQKEASAPITQYYGALALIKEGLVHLVKDAPAELRKWVELADPDVTPMPVIWYIVQEVALKVEFSFTGTLPWVKKTEPTSPNKSSPTS